MKKFFWIIFLICFLTNVSVSAFEEEEDTVVSDEDYIEFPLTSQQQSAEEEMPFSLHIERNEPLHGKLINTKLQDLNEVSAYSRPINLPLGDMVIGVSAFSTDPHKIEYDNVRFLGKYRYKRIKLNTQLSQLRTDKVNNALSNTILLSPELDVTKNLSLKTDFSSDFRTKDNKSGLSINYHPDKSSRKLEFELGVMNSYKENSNISGQKFRFLTKFQI